ncbi:cardiolipin synthase ClsB [Aquabacterium sp.]|uniref:cardiolipin synthase ClsB n=1 Tax=Aquabacterium sp. TaxID=1872578 RepID=UPI0035B1463E
MTARPELPPSESTVSYEALAPLAWYAQRRPVYTGGNVATLLQGGRELFPALRDSIDRAKRSVWMAVYIVSPEGQSSTVLQALMRAARRGVDVHVVVDGVGSREASPQLWQSMEQAGVKLAIYRPLHRLWSILDAGQWRRMHLKLCVVDERAAFIGGINLIDDHYDLTHGWSDTPRLDYAVEAQGPVVTPMLHTIKAMWTRAKVGRDWRDDWVHLAQDPNKLQHLREMWQRARLRLTPHEQSQLSAAEADDRPMRCAFVLRDNLRQRRTIELAALQAILQAKECVDIVTPYFYPRRALRRALKQAAARGVRVRLLLQGKLDYRIAGMAAQVLYGELQSQGIRIYEYQPAFLHAKVLCVDQQWATIGSSNLDPLSLLLNLEANLIVQDAPFVAALSEKLASDFALSREVPPSASPGSDNWRTRWKRHWVAFVAKAYLWMAGATGRY